MGIALDGMIRLTRGSGGSTSMTTHESILQVHPVEGAHSIFFCF